MPITENTLNGLARLARGPKVSDAAIRRELGVDQETLIHAANILRRELGLQDGGHLPPALRARPDFRRVG